MTNREQIGKILNDFVLDIKVGTLLTDHINETVNHLLSLDFVENDVIEEACCRHLSFHIESMHPYGDMGKICTDCGKYLGFAETNS